MGDSENGMKRGGIAATVRERAQADTSSTGEKPQDEFRSVFNEDLETILDIGKWRQGENLGEVYERISREIEQSLKDEARVTETIRKELFSEIRNASDIPDLAGVYRLPPARIEDAHKNVLFNGLVEACDGTVASVDTIPITITQISVCLVSYSGQQGSWTQRLFQRDFRGSGQNLLDEMYSLLEARKKRAAVDIESGADSLSMLARRAVMTYAERAILLDHSATPWRMGQGNPAPYELLIGSGRPEMVRTSIPVLRRLVDHEKFIFVPSTIKDRLLLTLGQSLRPMEYLIYDSAKHNLKKLTDRGHYRGEGWEDVKEIVDAYIEDCGPKIVIGMYRVARHSPPQVFYAHRDHVHEAALIAMADSVMQEHRGFPMLLDLADHACRAVFGIDIFMGVTQLAFSSVGEPFRFMSERSTRS